MLTSKQSRARATRSILVASLLSLAVAAPAFAGECPKDKSGSNPLAGRRHRAGGRDRDGARVDRSLEGKRQAARAPAALPPHGDPARRHRAAAFACRPSRR